MVEIMPDVSGRENRQLGDTFVSGPSHLEEESKGVREQVCRDEDNQPILHGDAAHQRVVEEISGLRGQVATEGIPREEKQPASSPSSAAASSVPSTTVASLIQSAAKISILDYDRPEVRRHSSTNEPMRLFQDDEYDDLESPSLKSLQKKVLPAIPDEQDRKRFVVSTYLVHLSTPMIIALTICSSPLNQGCLAAVIASAYDYDEGERENDATNQSSNHQQILDSSYSNSFYDSMDDEEFFCSESIGSACSDGCNRPPSNRTRQRQHYQTSVPPRQSTHSKSMPTMGARVQNAAVLALTRHRKRRYDVFCRFLASTAELLGLDKMYGKGFLPILHKLLIPTASSAKDNQRRRAPDTRTFQPSGYASDEDFLERRINEIEHLRPFLEGLGPGAGLRCLAMFLLQHLLHSAEGYDARIRHAIKKLGVLVLLHDLMLERKEQQAEDLHALSSRPPSTEEITWMHSKLELEPADLVTLATRKYESLEQSIAMKLIELSVAQRQLEMEMSGRSGKRTKATSWNLASRETNGSSRDNILRGLKIGGTALAAGTLFAITGGLGKMCAVLCILAPS